MNYKQYKSSLINNSNKPDVAEKAASLTEEWWSIRGKGMYMSTIGADPQKKQNRALRKQLYGPCREHVMVGFIGVGGFIIGLIIQAIVSWIVKKILDRLIDDLNNNKDSLQEA